MRRRAEILLVILLSLLATRIFGSSTLLPQAEWERAIERLQRVIPVICQLSLLFFILNFVRRGFDETIVFKRTFFKRLAEADIDIKVLGVVSVAIFIALIALQLVLILQLEHVVSSFAR